MAEEARVRVRLDTGRAKGELRELTREADRESKRVGGRVKAAVAGAVLGAGISAIGRARAGVTGSSTGAIGDLAGETFGNWGAILNDWIFGKADDEARAAKAAREQTIQAFGSFIGATGAVPPQARTFFQQVRSLRLEEEKGRSIVQQDSAFFGPGLGTVVERLIESIVAEVKKGFEKLGEILNPLNWF